MIGLACGTQYTYYAAIHVAEGINNRALGTQCRAVGARVLANRTLLACGRARARSVVARGARGVCAGG